MRPIMFGALRRNLLLEELAQSFEEREMRDEMFICGLFSLLDHMLKQPFEKLLQSIPMPERVRQALVDETGPYQPPPGAGAPSRPAVSSTSASDATA